MINGVKRHISNYSSFPTIDHWCTANKT